MTLELTTAGVGESGPRSEEPDKGCAPESLIFYERVLVCRTGPVPSWARVHPESGPPPPPHPPSLWTVGQGVSDVKEGIDEVEGYQTPPHVPETSPPPWVSTQVRR